MFDSATHLKPHNYSVKFVSRPTSTHGSLTCQAASSTKPAKIANTLQASKYLERISVRAVSREGDQCLEATDGKPWIDSPLRFGRCFMADIID